MAPRPHEFNCLTLLVCGVSCSYHSSPALSYYAVLYCNICTAVLNYVVYFSTLYCMYCQLACPACTRCKVMPIARGHGIDQRLLLNFYRRLLAGGWCHIFPGNAICLENCLPVVWWVTRSRSVYPRCGTEPVLGCLLSDRPTDEARPQTVTQTTGLACVQQ